MKSWFIASLIGIFFALAPVWFWFHSRVPTTALTSKKRIPDWMFRLAGGNTKTGRIKKGLLPVRYGALLSQIMSIMWVVICLFFYHRLLWAVISKASAFDLLRIETSFPLFIVATWGLFVWRFESYLKGLKSKKEEEEDATSK